MLLLLFLPLILGSDASPGADRPLVRMGSKKFTESVILGTLGAQLLESAGAQAEHLAQLGGTRILWEAVQSGEIDVYPEYTGTLRLELLEKPDLRDIDGLRQALAPLGLRATVPFGFNNTYAIGMAEERAEELGITKVSDLRNHPDLSFGFSDEFMKREDGWPGLKAHYGLMQTDVRGMDHDLSYRGLKSGDLDAVDAYTTDADVDWYKIRILKDDRAWFPAYHALFLYRADLEARVPGAEAALRSLEGKIDDPTMTGLNRRVKMDRQPEAQVAAAFLRDKVGVEVKAAAVESAGAAMLRHGLDHLALVGISLSMAIALAIPLGVAAARFARAGGWILGVVGIIQTIPSLALLVFMIPLLGIGTAPAIAALFLYSLLPIVRNTYTGLTGIARPLQDSARALGLSDWARLKRVELPLATPSIIAGIQTSAVINVGTATLGALIGAGGFGQPILTGIRLDDVSLILQGAVPAAVLAVVVERIFDLLQRRLVPRGMRQRA